MADETAAAVVPPWLEGLDEAASPPAAPGRWYKGMPSPNKAGRPPGITDRKARLAQRMLADADGIVAAMVEKALEGDAGCASIILSRCIPTLRGQHERVQFAFDAAAPVPQQIEAVLTAIAAGAVAPDVGQTIIAALGTLADARAVADLEQRVVMLEARPL